MKNTVPDYKYKIIFFFAWLALVLSACSGDTQDKSLTATDNQSKVSDTKRTVLDAYIEVFSTGENNIVRAVAIDNNNLWFGTSSGVLHIDRISGKLLNSYGRKDGLKNEYVFAIAIDRDGTKWFGTNAGGMTRFDGKNWKTYIPKDGLADYWIYAFDFEKDGTMWIGTWAGVNKFDGKEFTTYSVPEGLINEWVYGVSVDKNNVKWFGTEGGITRYDGTTWKSWLNKDGLGAPSNGTEGHSNNTALGTRDRHNLNINDPSGSNTYMVNYIFCSFVDKDDYKWFGTWGGGVSRFDGTTFTNYTVDDGLSGNVVYAITQGVDGAMWFATNNGLSKFHNGNWETLTRSDGLISDHIYDLKIDRDGNIWLGQKGGVVRVTEKKLVRKPVVPVKLF